MRRLPLLVLAMISAIGAPLTAQVHPLVGAWDIVFSAGGPGTPYPASTPPGKTAFLNLTQQGDSLIGELLLDPLDGQSVPVRMAARISAGEITFESRAPAQTNAGGQATTVATWVFNASGDMLAGTVQCRVEGLATPPSPQPPSQFKGTRMQVLMGTPG